MNSICDLMSSLYFPLFCPYQPKQEKILRFAHNLIQEPCGSPLCFPCKVVIDVHRGAYIRVSEKFLYIFRPYAARRQVACIGESERMETKIH